MNTSPDYVGPTEGTKPYPNEVPAMLKRIVLLFAAMCLLFGTSFAGRDPFDTGAKDGYFRTSDGLRLHYYEAGKGPAIVFVPGWTVPAWMWYPQIRHFSKEHHVIALDPRSQGQSARSDEGNYSERRARDIKELVEKLELAPAVLVGHSLAVTELLSYLEQFGANSVAGVVLVDQGLGPYEATPQIVGLMHQVGTNRRQFLEQMGSWFFRKPTPPGYTDRLYNDAMKTPTNTAIALIASRIGTDYRPTLQRVDVPILFMCTPQFKDAADWLKENVPNAKVEMFEDSGHVIFMDDADRFNSTLERFARGAFERRRAPRERP